MPASLTREVAAAEFEQINSITNLLDRKLALAELCNKLAESHGLDRETVETLFALYQQEKAFPAFASLSLARLAKVSVIQDALKNIAFLAVIGSAVNFAFSQREAHIQFIQDQWVVAETGPKIGTVRKDAIEYLANRNLNLSGLRSQQTFLAYLRMPRKASLQNADFSGSNLYQAAIVAANLAYSTFSSPVDAKLRGDYTNLHDANLSESDLRESQFKGAFMKGACLRNTNLEKANFERAILTGADFRGARHLKASQFINAINAKEALFDHDLAVAIGAHAPLKRRPPASCSIKPANRFALGL